MAFNYWDRLQYIWEWRTKRKPSITQLCWSISQSMITGAASVHYTLNKSTLSSSHPREYSLAYLVRPVPSIDLLPKGVSTLRDHHVLCFVLIKSLPDFSRIWTFCLITKEKLRKKLRWVAKRKLRIFLHLTTTFSFTAQQQNRYLQ